MSALSEISKAIEEVTKAERMAMSRIIYRRFFESPEGRAERLRRGNWPWDEAGVDLGLYGRSVDLDRRIAVERENEIEREMTPQGAD